MLKNHQLSHFDQYIRLPERFQNRRPELIQWFDYDWNSDCQGYHEIGICDLGQVFCRVCLVHFSGQKEWVMIIPYLKDQYGDDWQSELEKLQYTRRLVRPGQFDKLILTVIDYRNEDGTFKTTRFFYTPKEV